MLMLMLLLLLPGRLQVSEIAGVKLDREVNVVAMADGQVLPLPPNSGGIGPDGKVSRSLSGIHMQQLW
jgi:hypothetical protein